MKKLYTIIIAIFIISIIFSCTNKIGTGLTPLYQNVACINSFYKENNRLPTNNDELVKFASDNKMPLDLSVFKIFSYSMNTDSTYIVKFEINADAKGVGSITINPQKPVNQ
jgi:hypothetical protein